MTSWLIRQKSPLVVIAKLMVTLLLHMVVSSTGSLRLARNVSPLSRALDVATGVMQRMISENLRGNLENPHNAKRKEKRSVRSSWKRTGRSMLSI